MTTDPAVSAYKKAKPDIKGFLHDAPYMLLIAGSLCCLMGVFFPYFYLQLFAILHGINPTFAFYTLAILNGSSIPGRILPNIFANKYGGFNLLIASCVACAALIFGLYGIDAVGSTTVFAILYGFFSGAFLSLLSPAVASLSKDQGEIGVRLGLAFFLAAPGALVGAPINGYLLGDTFPWSKTILFSAIIILAGSAILTFGRILLARRKGTPFV
ncbi:MFS general substrate transporter [Dentipellis sp. KUC8613]|nr:MFS general substrate transporter [Dentipellis sp. KUC8613]